jgi:hypothetical protein
LKRYKGFDPGAKPAKREGCSLSIPLLWRNVSQRAAQGGEHGFELQRRAMATVLKAQVDMATGGQGCYQLAGRSRRQVGKSESLRDSGPEYRQTDRRPITLIPLI